MTVETDLTALLKTICTRTFPDFAPVGTARPYVTYQQIGGAAPVFVDNTVPDTENGEFQINVWADTRMQAKDLIKQIEAALILETQFQARPIGAAVSDFDADVPVYGARQDFSIWSVR